MTVRVAVAPVLAELLEPTIREAGAEPSAPEDADAIVWTVPGDPQGLAALLKDSRARWVQLPFAGIEAFFEANVIDAERTWTCAKGVYGHATAEQALTLMLTAARQVPHHVRAATWGAQGSERRLAGTTAVIVGTGGIGSALAEMLTPLKVRVLGVNRSGRALPGAERTVVFTDLLDIVGEADWVVVAAALTEQTRGLIGKDVFDAMKEGAWLINVARGGLVDTDALMDALRSGRLGGAGLDVTDPEPLPDGHPLWRMDNVIVTSHTANTVSMAIPELTGMVDRNLRRFIAGEPLEGLVDPRAGY